MFFNIKKKKSIYSNSYKNQGGEADVRIIELVQKKSRKINVVSFYNNGSRVFIKLFKYALEEGKSILYITEEYSRDRGVVRALRNTRMPYEYISSDNGGNIISRGINICSSHMVPYIKEKFDIVIYDDINSIPEQDNEYIKYTMEKRCGDYGTMIAYGVEKMFDGEDTVYSLSFNGKPLIEPRIINTRLNIESDIPSMIFDYIKWLMNKKEKIIIYVPHGEKVEGIYRYLRLFRDEFGDNIFKYKKFKDNPSVLDDFAKSTRSIIITDSFKREHIDLSSASVMIFFSDYDVFTYKKLIYLASRAKRNVEKQGEEVIFLANTESENMSKAKDIMRELNKEAWELGFIEI